MSTRFIRRQLSLAAFPALALSTLAHAEAVETPFESQGYYAALGVEVDDANFQELQAEFAVPVGVTGWVQLDIGTTTASLDEQEDVDMATAGLRAGFRSGHVDWRAMYAYRENGSSYTQHDLFGGFTYVVTRGSLGLDLFYRSADYETTASLERRFRDPLAIRVTKTTEGIGIGAHGEWFVSESLTLAAGGMTYDYGNSPDQAADLARLERISLSGVTRDEAYLHDSINVGATYRFAVLSLGATYYRDREVDNGFVTDTAELYADIPLTMRWALAAWVGHAMTEDEPGLTYGGARISVVW